jgi:Domain of unknown function (DUF5658)
MNKLLAIFIGLQIGDIITTIIFLSMGVQEANPIVKAAIVHFGPLPGLLLIKIIAIGLALWWYSRNKERMVLVNCFYAVLVCWNIIAINRA